MQVPHWSMIVLFGGVVVQFILSWLRVKKTGSSFRTTVLTNALWVGAFSLIFLRGFFGDLPLWIDAPIAVLCSLSILTVLGLELFRLKRYLKESWRLENK